MTETPRVTVEGLHDLHRRIEEPMTLEMIHDVCLKINPVGNVYLLITLILRIYGYNKEDEMYFRDKCIYGTDEYLSINSVQGGCIMKLGRKTDVTIIHKLSLSWLNLVVYEDNETKAKHYLYCDMIPFLTDAENKQIENTFQMIINNVRRIECRNNEEKRKEEQIKFDKIRELWFN